MDKRGKTLLKISVVFLVLISLSLYFILALENNTKTYDSETKTITIKSGVSEVATIKLNTPLVYNVIRGKDRLVAEFTINNFDDYSNVFNDMEFYDVKNNMQKFDRKFNYKYKTFYDVNVPDFETVCKEREVTGTNGTYIEKYDCVKNKIGSHIEQRFNWNDFNEKVDLPKGEITLGIFTDVLPNEKVEWIPTMFGVRINEWAVWTESLNVDLRAYYKLDETSGNAVESVTGQYNGTLTTTTQNLTGIIGKAVNYTSTNSYITINGGVNFTSAPFTYNGWVYCTNKDPFFDNMYWMGTGVAGANGWAFYNSYSPYGGLVFGKPYVDEVDSGYYLPVGSWQMITVDYNRTHINFYVNGSQVGATPAYTTTFSDANYRMGQSSAANTGGGYINDEVGVWNRSLTSSEISDLYNNGTGITYTDVFDTTPPNVTIVSPLPINYTAHAIDFNITVIDESAISSCWYTLNNGINNITMENDTASNFYHTNSSMTKGNYTAKFFCDDIFNNLNNTEQVSFTILNAPPTHDNPSLETSTKKNLSTEDLICYNKSTSDPDNDEVINIYNWYKNNQTFLALNLAFENNTNDYSGNNNHGTRYGATSTDGKIGGAYEFDGVDDYIKATKNFGTSFNAFSAEAWVNLKNIGTQHRYILERDDIHFYISVMPDRKIRFRHIDLTNGATETETNVMEFNEWTHIVAVYDGAKTYIYVNGELKKEQEDTGNISFSASEHLYIGSSKYAPSYPDRTWNGSIDEVKVYTHALTQQQIINNYNLISNTLVSQEITTGDNWICQVTPTDGEEDGVTKNSSDLSVLWGITFNVTDGEDGSQITSLDNIVCNNSWSSGFVNSPFEFGFEPGSYSCTFSKLDFYNRIKIFVADANKTVDIKLSFKESLTIEEHTWLEAIYECIINKNCDLYNLLLEINQTVGNIWEHTALTDESVVLSEVITNKVIDASNNLTIDYSVYIPIKAGYGEGDYLPIRIGYWFLDTTNTTCYNQGERPEGVSDPYCQPLIIETIGPMGGTVNFTVELQPSLPEGDYSIKRIIDIDPLGVWHNYGQELISTFTVLEGLSTYGASVENIGEVMPERNLIESIKSGITGAVTGVGNYFLLSGWQIVAIVAIIGGVFVVFIINKTVLRIKEKIN